MVYRSCSLAASTAFQPALASSSNSFQTPSLPLAATLAVGNAPTIGSTNNNLSNTFNRRRRTPTWLLVKKNPKTEEDEEGEENLVSPATRSEREFLKDELEHVESLEEILRELEEFGGTVDDNDEDDDFFMEDFDQETLEQLFQSLEEDEEEDEEDETYLKMTRNQQSTSLLENALLQGVVAPEAGVGSNSLPGDFNFDPLDLASKDYFPKAQKFFRGLIPGGGDDNEAESDVDTKPRPKALILRDYREAEIRHGRLAMLAAVFWPLQELLDRLVLDEEKFNSLLFSLFFGGVTLPYFPLLMTAIMLLLGYLDIYSQTIKDVDKLGDAFLPGDCFWDPLQILTAATDRMKRNMQERELFNGRFAMLAVAVFVYEEARTGKPVVAIPGNEILFEPAYQVPFIQEWLDSRFASPSPVFYRFSEQDIVDTITSANLFFSNFGDAISLST